MKEKQINPRQIVKKRLLRPYFGELAFSVIVYIFAPIILFLNFIGSVFKGTGTVYMWVLIIFLGIVAYSGSFDQYIWMGIHILRDRIKNSYETCEIEYKSSVSLGYCFRIYGRKADGNYLHLLSAKYRALEKYRTYQVVYGKHSKIVMSIASAKEVTVLNKETKKEAVLPFRWRFFHAISTFIFAPLFTIIFAFDWFGNGEASRYSILLFILAILSFSLYVRPHFLPGLRLLRDYIRNQFISCEFTYRASVLDEYHYISPKRDFVLVPRKKVKEEMEQLSYEYGETKDHKQLILSSARFHRMQSGKTYRVTYGKHSKALVSCLSKDNQEMWDISFQEWLLERNKEEIERDRQERKRKKQEKR